MSLILPPPLVERREFANQRLDDLRRQVSTLGLLREQPEVCVFVTGSYGRGEASVHSDIDLFLLHPTQRPLDTWSREVIAQIQTCTERLALPPFSKAGDYLMPHVVKDILSCMGSPEDDHKNYFTARMLLLLEGQSLWNDNAFEKARAQILNAYFRDLPDHRNDFNPHFLLNDVVRFWKTLCLNYEERRNRPEDAAQTAKHRLKNVKLRYSRVLTCFATVAALATYPDRVERASQVIFDLSPTERLEHVSHQGLADAEPQVQALLDEYAVFLEMVGRPEGELLDYLADNDVWLEWRRRAAEFGNGMFYLLAALDTPRLQLLRHLLI